MEKVASNKEAREISSLKTEDDKKQFKHELEVELADYTKRSVIDLTEQEAAKELLLRFYLMGCKFESIGGELSRVAWMEMPKPSGKENWQEAAKHRNDVVSGELDPELHVEKLYEDDEYEFVKDLMRRAGMEFDARIENRDKALAKREDGMNEYYHADPFLDRAHSTGLVNKLITGDILMRQVSEDVVKTRQLYTEVVQKRQEWRNNDVSRGKIAKVICVISRYQQRRRHDFDVIAAEEKLKRAEKVREDAQNALSVSLDAAYSQDVQGKHYHLRVGVARINRMKEFYQKFFDCTWPYDALVRNSGNAQKSGEAAQLTSRQTELERISKLRVCLGMEI